MKQLVLGIDIGGTNTEFAFIDKSGKSIKHQHLLTQNYDVFKDLVSAIYSKSMQVLNDEKIELAGVGIGAPNGNHYSGNIEYAPNLPWQGIVPLKQLFEEQFSLPVTVTNDANAAAVGEMMFGGAKNMKHFVVITLGTGLGSGFVIDGKVLYGHDGFAGELGHTIVIPNGRKCSCGNKGCLEAYVSARGITQTYRELSNNTKAYTPEEIADKATHGDNTALVTFQETGKLLGRKLADVVSITSPEAIFLFGGIANAGDLILIPAKIEMERNLLAIFNSKIKILPSRLSTKNAAVTGAGALIWDQISKDMMSHL